MKQIHYFIKYTVSCILVTASILNTCYSMNAIQGDKKNHRLHNVEEKAVEEESNVEKSKTFLKLADRHAALILQTAPEWSTQLGVEEKIGGNNYSQKLSDYSVAHNQSVRDLNRRLLNELRDIDPSTLQGTAAVTYAVMLNAYDIAFRQNEQKTGIASLLGANPPYVVNQLFSPHIDLPRLFIAQQPLHNEKDVENYLIRLKLFAKTISNFGQLVKHDAQHGIIPPDFTLKAVAKSSRKFVSSDVAQHPILISFEQQLNQLASLTKDKKSHYRQTAESLIHQKIYPAYKKFVTLIEGLISKAGKDAGIWRLKNGEELYQIALDAYGANGLTAEEIHHIGLEDVARIHQQMDTILQGIGYAKGTINQRMQRLAKDPNYLVPNTDQAKNKLLKRLTSDVNAVHQLAPNWFGALPPQALVVKRIPVYEQDGAAGAYYLPPSLDGSKPGTFWINLKDTADWPIYTLNTLVYHEAIPGHHFQASLALDVKDMPLIRNMMFFSEFGEGWAMYAEELAVEMGLYKNFPLGNLGRLRSEVYRAARLVVDTGLHYKRWSREQAIQWMVEATGENTPAITREIERYAVWPGQATSYKLGMMRFQKLRTLAEQELGTKFEIKVFHDKLLLDGTMPMPVLEARIRDWIKWEKQQ